jgi:hypothetical protein
VKGQKPGLPIHLIVLGTSSATVLLVLSLFFFRRIVQIFEAYHGVFVVGFVAVVSLWSYWVVYAIIKRKVEQHDVHRQRET